MKKVLFLLFIICSLKNISAQNKLSPEDFGFRYFKIIYKGDVVNILVKSKKGEELKQKPLFFFCQGSLPVPLILVDEKGPFGTFPFTADSLINDYHLVIVGKPGIPVAAEIKNLDKDFTYYERQPKHFPFSYIERNNLDYYVRRNKEVIRFLQKQSWVSSNKSVVAGHSEGSYIAARIASELKTVNHLIYSGGNPLGRILTIITRNREDETDSLHIAEQTFKEWEAMVQNPEKKDSTVGDPYKTTYSFSTSLMDDFKKINIPVLVTYGTRDASAAPFNDYLRIEMIRLKKKNISFISYIGKEHNYFSLQKDGEINYDNYNWDKVVSDWLRWLKNN